MPRKSKTIKLTDGNAPLRPGSEFTSEEEWRKAMTFRVEQLTESIEYQIGQLLQRAEVKQLCDSPHWKVTIVANK